MKIIFYFSTFLCLLFYSTIDLNAQNNQWNYYNSYGYVTGINELGNKIWITSYGGLVQHDTVSNSDEYLNNLNSGMAYNKVTCMAKDLNGRMLLGTFGHGLLIFDGSNWFTYDTTNSSIPENRITSICADTSSNIWVCTFKGSVAKFDGFSWTTFSPLTFGSSILTAMCSDKNSNIWVGTLNNGLFCYNGIQWKNYNSSTTFQGSVKSIVADSSGLVYIATTNKVKQFDGTNWSNLSIVTSPASTGFIQNLTIDAKNHLWICAQNGVFEFHTSLLNHYTTTNSGIISDVNTIFKANNGLMCFGSFYGVCFYDGISWQFDSLTTSIYNQQANDLVLQKKGAKIWVNSWDGSLNSFNGINWHRNFQAYSKYESMGKMSFNSSSDSLWIATYNGLKLYHNNSFQVYSATSTGFPYDFLSVVNAEKKGVILFADDSGHIIKMITPTCNIAAIYDTVLYSTIKCITYDSKKGAYWIGTHGRGMLKFDMNGFVIYDKWNSGILSNDINDIQIAPNGNKWIATNDYGLINFNDTIWTNYNSMTSSLVSNKLTSICFDNYSNLWIGTMDRGIVKYNGATWINYNTWNSKLPFDGIMKIVKDSINNIWVGTKNGVVRINNGIWLQSDNTVNMNKNQIDFEIYPNPASNMIHFDFSISNNNKPLELEVINSLGQLISSQYYTPFQSIVNYSVESLADGIYLAFLKDQGSIIAKSKFIVKH
ncbi:MAG: two-component regulator propeller domain-containing protein [Bacteroidota bacterium]